MSVKGDFGVNLAAYELMRCGWRVYLNGGLLNKRHQELQGADILAIKASRKPVRMEVKFRDVFKKTNTTAVNFTKLEYEEMTHVALVLRSVDGKYEIYIAPKDKLKRGWGYKNLRVILISHIKDNSIAPDAL